MKKVTSQLSSRAYHSLCFSA